MLWLIAALAAAGALLAVYAAAKMPLATVAVDAQPAPHSPTTRAAPRDRALPPLASFAPAWRLHLRRPLVDPPAPAPVRLASSKAAKRAKPGIRLIGTIVDGKQSKGLFITGLSQIELKSVGQTVAGATIVAIDDNSATLTSGGDSFTLKRERTPFDPTGAAYDTPARASIANDNSDSDSGS
jgi:hypothetical protein